MYLFKAGKCWALKLELRMNNGSFSQSQERLVRKKRDHTAVFEKGAAKIRTQNEVCR